ncbi:LysR substrate-binding domain-containing protein [Thalassomonas sp. RHCl1]|uniref:LysR substrate-binding domain-containing protein n=1 Tax=Thalassomonas sp. RHCl1 TaxID=2995320 RepID=UPI00248CC371|nr:LysR substrate-binding domain-containing protein [Thalassomonas sp. RHCl1]
MLKLSFIFTNVRKYPAQGHGIARLPRFMMQDYLDRGEFVPILPDYNTQPLEISMVYSQNNLNNPALTAFIEFIR